MRYLPQLTEKGEITRSPTLNFVTLGPAETMVPTTS